MKSTILKAHGMCTDKNYNKVFNFINPNSLSIVAEQ